ncbi:MAG: hypothetical protein K2P53_06190 [Rickettsiales bacterium]|jgi:hypothetical protein|nr:hypothetical protein [Rickettsiales bacterium]
MGKQTPDIEVANQCEILVANASILYNLFILSGLSINEMLKNIKCKQYD